MFANGVPVNVVEVHGHGTPRPQGVAADSFRREAFFIKAEGAYGAFDHFVDVTGLEGAWTFGCGGVICADDVVVCALWVRHDVVDPSGEGSYGAGFGAGGIVTDEAPPRAVFLVGDAHYGLGSHVESVERRRVGDEVEVFVIESDVASAKLFVRRFSLLRWLVYSPTLRR